MNLFSDLFSSIWGIFFVVVFLGGSIFLHELGHYLAARKRGLKIERFSIGFGPKICSWTRNGVEWRLSWIPFGGYVALPQMTQIESIEGKTSTPSEQLPPISTTDKIVVAIMGPAFNILTALVLAVVLWLIGLPTTDPSKGPPVIGHILDSKQVEVNKSKSASNIGKKLQPGDRILAVDGQSIRDFNTFRHLIAAGSGRTDEKKPQATLKIKRNEEIREIDVIPRIEQQNSMTGEYYRTMDIIPAYDLQIRGILDPSPAKKAGLKPGDIIRSVDGNKVYTIQTIQEYLKNKAGKPVTLQIERDGEVIKRQMIPKSFPTTKPVAKLTFPSSSPIQELKIIPEYQNENVSDPTDPSTPANLLVYDVHAPDNETVSNIRFEDRIMAVNETKPKSLKHLLTIVQEADQRSLRLEIKDQEDISGNQNTNQAKLSETTREMELPEPTNTTLIPSETEVRLGFSGLPKQRLIYPTPIDQFDKNITLTLSVLSGLFHPDSDIQVKNLGGPVSIGRIIYKLSGISFRKLIWFVVFMNINLAILNMLPLPILDGGHITLAIATKIRGKQLPPPLINAIQSVAMICLMGLMLYIVFNDVLRWFGDAELSENRRLEFEKQQAKSIDYSSLQ